MPDLSVRLGRLELRFLDWWARVVMVLNPAMAEEAKAAGLPAERLVWMPNPVDTAVFAPLAPAGRLALRDRLGAFYAKRTLTGQTVTLESQVRAIVAFLAGDFDRTTGQVVNVDGGLAAAFLR